MSTDLPPLPRCARVVEYNASKGYSFDAYTEEQMLAYASAAMAAERERCAKIVETANVAGAGLFRRDLAARIRATPPKDKP